MTTGSTTSRNKAETRNSSGSPFLGRVVAPGAAVGGAEPSVPSVTATYVSRLSESTKGSASEPLARDIIADIELEAIVNRPELDDCTRIDRCH